MNQEYPIALKSVDIQTSLRGLFAEINVTQAYENRGKTDIEAVYTFPLPLDAVLLEVTLELNGEIQRGWVQHKNEAQEQYEDAVEEGDVAVLLEQVEPGVFALSAGNLKSGEQAVVRFRYGLLLKWNGDQLRLHMPTTLAPRYGDPATAGWAPHLAPEAYALSPGFGFSCKVRVEGALAQADFECPSHPVKISTDNDAREFALSGESALMDRDFVLVLKKPADFSTHGFWAPDAQSPDGNYVGLISFCPRCPRNEESMSTRRCVKLVVDCSGSMGGSSIDQAKSALRKILSLLNPGDEFEVIAFGSHVKSCFDELVSVDRRSLARAEEFVDGLDANMGGTETEEALNCAYRCGDRAGDVLLITDGQIYGHAEAIAKAKESGHRIFSVGVGSAAAESAIRGLAEATSGAYELVSPREGMADRIVRHFQRIDSPKVASVNLEGEDDLIFQGPIQVGTVFSGETFHLFFQLNRPSESNIRLVVTFEGGQTYQEEVSQWSRLEDAKGEQPSSLPRMAAHSKLSGLDAKDDAKEAAQMAVDYQLVTKYTSCALVLERKTGEKADGRPALRKVPQTLAAGWGGLILCSMSTDIPRTDRRGERMPGMCRSIRQPHIRDFISSINGFSEQALRDRLDSWTIDEFSRLVDSDLTILELLDQLKNIASDDGVEEKIVIAVFLALLSVKWSSKKFHAHAVRMIWEAFNAAEPSHELITKVASIIGPDRQGSVRDGSTRRRITMP